MSARSTIDAGRLGIMLNELRLPSMKAMWADFAARADEEGWPAARFLGSRASQARSVPSVAYAPKTLAVP